ncbi:MAG TPA: 23S rRNA (uracil(1939)-C(5))-methyltransferase RlmD [Terriglobales bacterium]|nr:23S rRNA (uracil(1939)-C(5))-methyltransferase RlmD [Terriglobales bacterium]
MELNIEKVVYGGDGLARLPGDEHGRGKAVFVPFVLAGERIDASLTEEKPGFARATLGQVIERSLYRTEPLCPYFTRCGGCHYQHSTYEHQLEIKSSILKENLRRIAKLELATELQIHSSPPWNYRNRTRMRVQSVPFLLGYNRFGTRELQAIEECPISSPLINQAIGAVWELGREGNIDAALREIEFFANADDSQLLVEVYVASDVTGQQAETVCETLCHSISGAAGVTAFAIPRPQTSSIAEARALAQVGISALEYSTAEFKYRVSAGSFFQTNRYLVEELLSIVIDRQSGQSALDLYAGVGLFATVLSRHFETVTAVESSPQSFADLEYNSPGNVRAVRAGAEQYLEKAGGKTKTDLIVVDPPRGGLGRKVVSILLRLRPRRLTYVSCDPATLARDLVPLLAGGYRVEQAHLVDLFPQTFHIESVLKLALNS